MNKATGYKFKVSCNYTTSNSKYQVWWRLTIKLDYLTKKAVPGRSEQYERYLMFGEFLLFNW